MGTTAFADWIEALQSRLGWSDTKLASEVGVSASTISLWKNRGITPRSEKHLDRLVEISGDGRGEVYSLAGRGYVGAEYEQLSPRMSEIAHEVQRRLDAIADPDSRELALDDFVTLIHAWSQGQERRNQFVQHIKKGS